MIWVEGEEKRILDFWMVLILIGSGFALVGVIIVGSVWGVMISLGVIVVDLYWYYVRRIKRKKPRYPLVSPEGRGDVYLPRTDIPRPVVADFRELEEKKRKFAKIRKMARKKLVRKKK